MQKNKWLKILKYFIPISIFVIIGYISIDFFFEYWRVTHPSSLVAHSPALPTGIASQSLSLHSRLTPFLNFPKDKEGVFLTDYANGAYRGISGFKYNPYNIADAAARLIEAYGKCKDPGLFDAFIDQEEWFEKNGKNLPNGGMVWQYDFPLDNRYKNLKVPWSSAFAQGGYIKYCSFAYKVLKDKKYFDKAHRALLAFEIDIKEGGVCWFGPGSLIFYEEVPSDPPQHIMNGMLMALCDIWEYYQVSKDELAKKIFNRGVQSVERLLPQYDTGFYSRYSLNPDAGFKDHYALNNWNYHALFIKLLSDLHEITNKDVFMRYAIIFTGYKNSFFDKIIKTAFFSFKYYIKNKFMIIILLLNIILLIIYLVFVFLLPRYRVNFYFIIIPSIFVICPFLFLLGLTLFI